ncbi:hypothetical protein FBY33_2725 [Arthrobacter sp. SLBN-112]|nr:hypothetical protein FBY33_2725 [Arthrobacter sp. SLBN-112]
MFLWVQAVARQCRALSVAAYVTSAAAGGNCAGPVRAPFYRASQAASGAKMHGSHDAALLPVQPTRRARFPTADTSSRNACSGSLLDTIRALGDVSQSPRKSATVVPARSSESVSTSTVARRAV